MQIKTTVTVTDLTPDDVVNILSCERGGFDYWAQTNPWRKQYGDARKELLDGGADGPILCYEDVLAQIVLHHDGLVVVDIEEDRQHLLTRDKLCRGIEQYINNGGDADPDEWDAISADCIMQYAIFGEVMYG